MLRIAIDGACRRNGKPDCVSSGGVFIVGINHEHYATRYTTQTESTNQRGEIGALLDALQHIGDVAEESVIVTDSEYIYNTITKGWLRSWSKKGWVTAENNPIKNQELWEQVLDQIDTLEALDIEVNYYHIKGHCISIGKVTAQNLLNEDPSGRQLYKAAFEKYDQSVDTKAAELQHAREVFVKNHDFEISDELLRSFVCMNTVADAIATKYVDSIDNGGA